MPFAYAGIGSRETPDDVLHLMRCIGFTLANRGHTLRSGGADKADSAFEEGCDRALGPKEIYLPWRLFNGNTSPLYTPSWRALDMAAQFHPAWDRCTQGAQKLHARNCHQVLGQDLDSPVLRVICWTKGAAGGGGTGQALRIARHHNIEIHDLADPALYQSYSDAVMLIN